MNELIKYLGIILILIGTAVLAVPQFMGAMTNTILLVGLFTIAIGIIVHIVINRKAE